MGKITATLTTPQGLTLASTSHLSNVKRTWVVNDAGTASFMMPAALPETALFLRRGHIVRIYEDNLPPWVGVVERRRFKGNAVTFECKGAEWFLHKRPMQQIVVGDGDLGRVAEQCFLSANQLSGAWTPVTTRDFQYGGPAVFKEYEGYKDLWETLKGLADEHHWNVWVDSSMTVHFRHSRGSDKSGQLFLYENKELTDVDVTEDEAEAVSNVLAIAGGSGNITERAKFGYAVPTQDFWRAEIINVDGAVGAAELEPAATRHLRKNFFPRITIDATVVSIGNLWAQLHLGDTVSVVTYQGGNRRSKTKIIGMEVSEPGKMRCVFEVVDDSYLGLWGWLGSGRDGEPPIYGKPNIP